MTYSLTHFIEANNNILYQINPNNGNICHSFVKNKIENVGDKKPIVLFYNLIKILPSSSPIMNNIFENNIHNLNNLNNNMNMMGNINMNMFNNNFTNNNMNIMNNNQSQQNQDNFIFVTFTLKKNLKQMYIDVNENESFGNMIKILEDKYSFLKNIPNKTYSYKGKIITDFNQTLKHLNINENSDIFILDDDNNNINNNIGINNINNANIQNNQVNNNANLVDFNRIIVIQFISTDQRINRGIKCLPSDLFVKVEQELYKIYPEFSKTNNSFITNGTTVLRFQTIAENKIKDGQVVQLIPID